MEQSKIIDTLETYQSMYPRKPKSEAFDNAVDVVELLLVPTDQAPNIQHLRVLHTFSSMTSLKLLI